MGYLFTVVWFVIAGYLVYTGIRKHRTAILFILAGYMAYLGVWELIDTISELDMKSGVYGWIYRGVALVVLIVCFIWYFLRRRGE